MNGNLILKKFCKIQKIVLKRPLPFLKMPL